MAPMDKILGKTYPTSDLLLLFAALKKQNKPNAATYKFMAAMSEGKLTHGALEKRFHKLKAAGIELAEQHPNLTDVAPPTVKAGTSAKKGEGNKRKGLAGNDGTDDEESGTPSKKPKTEAKTQKIATTKTEKVKGDKGRGRARTVKAEAKDE